MPNKVTHFFPDAMVIFVKGFTSNTPKLEDTIIAKNTTEIKEISAVSVNLTVKNNPGTFSITLVDTANRFIEPDEPDKEIEALSAQARRKVSTTTRKITTTPGADASFTNTMSESSLGGNYYEFTDYKDWLSFVYGTVEDKTIGIRYPVSYRRDKSGKIVERWAFDDSGAIIKIVTIGTKYTEEAFQNAKNGETQTYPVLESNSTTSNSKEYVLWKNSNQEFATQYKDVEEQGLGDSNFAKGRCKISPMDRVVIFMSQRFNSDKTVNETANHKMMRVFTGVVNAVEQSYSENQNTINITGEDVTKYIRLSVVNINPALPLSTGKIVDQTADETISILQDTFKGMSPAEIVRILLLGGRTKNEFESRDIRGVSQYVISRLSSGKNYVYDPTADLFEEENAPKKQSKSHSIADISKMLGTLFKPSSVHIIDPFRSGANLKGYRPYEIAFNSSWSYYQAGFKTRREIINSIAEETNFTFYADKNGHIWFRPPRFDNSHILGAQNPSIYIIDTESIVSFGFIEDDSNMYSSVYIGTAPPLGMAAGVQFGMYNTSFRDDLIVLKYGQRFFTYFNPLIRVSWEQGDAATNQVLMLHAKTILQKIVASQYQGQITILGRPELDPGYPIYIPIRNKIYYVESVEHSLTYGSQFTTTLHLSYGRKPWEMLPELLTFAANDEVYQGGGDVLVRKSKSAEDGAEIEFVPADYYAIDKLKVQSNTQPEFTKSPGLMTHHTKPGFK